MKSIEKINDYTGKIYDVDVENDIILVRRRSLVNIGSTNNRLQTTDSNYGIWSGNSNNGTAVGGVVMNMTGGKYGGAAQFDGVDDYVDAGNSSSLSPISTLTVSFWMKANEVQKK